MIGYLDPEEGGTGIDEEGWFATGDLMEVDADGYLRLIDRKKEIYKNIKGETIAPQRIENLFRDFESVGRVFLVGDHREYNTALIYPNPAYAPLDLNALPPDDLKSHFRSIVASVNTFLAPFERDRVDFSLLDRDLDPERGELTAKGTPKREKLVEKNLEAEIRLLYRRSQLKAGGVDLLFPNWLFQALGATAQDLTIGDGVVSSPLGEGRPPRTEAAEGLAGRLLPLPPSSGRAAEPGRPAPHAAAVAREREPRRTRDARRRAARAAGARGGGNRVGRPRRSVSGDDATKEAVKSALARKDLDLLDLHRAALLVGSGEEARPPRDPAPRARPVAEEGILAEPARLLLGRMATPSRRSSRGGARSRSGPERARVRASPPRSEVPRGTRRHARRRDRAALRERDLPDEKIEAMLAAEEGGADGARQGAPRVLAPPLLSSTARSTPAPTGASARSSCA